MHFVIPFPPGGAFDALGRPWAERIKSLLGTVVVENIGGGGASLGAAAVARARPDGYTILLGGTLPHVNEALLKSRPLYDPVKDLDPIGSIAANFISIAVHPSVPAHNLKEFIAYAKANSGKLSYGHAGIGSTNHLTGELFKMLAGTPELVQVPYRGMGPAMTDLFSGQLTMVVPAVTGQVLEFHRSGKMRVLAVTSPKRLSGAPELPTAAEGGLPGLTVTATLVRSHVYRLPVQAHAPCRLQVCQGAIRPAAPGSMPTRRRAVPSPSAICRRSRSSNATLRPALFERCDLYNFNAAHSSFRGVQFRQSTFSKAISRRSTLTKASFEGCNISFADLSGLFLQNCEFPYASSRRRPSSTPTSPPPR